MKPKIRISQKDKKEYNRLRRNAQNKLNRLKKNHNVDLTNEIEIKPLDTFEYREDFNQWKENIQSFTNRFNLNYQYKTNKYGVSQTVKEIQKMERLRRSEIAKAKREQRKQEKKTVVQDGKEYGTVKEKSMLMKEPEKVTGVRIPNPFDFDKIKSMNDFEYYKELGERRTSENYYFDSRKRMKDNFIRALEGSFNGEEEELVKLLQELNPNDFYNMWLRIDEFNFDNYDSDGVHITATTQSIDNMKKYINDWNNGLYDEQTKDLEKY